ncbi:MAG: four helix bundle protein [bacterium]|nr:four helix bundle protein [bacterium]
MRNDLNVIKKSKDLSGMIFEITERSPKKFRFTLVSKMQNLSLEVISELYMANDTFVDMKIISDMNKTIDFTKNIKSFKSEEERIYYRNKIFELKMTRAVKTEERVSRRLEHSYAALTKIKELDWLITLSAQMQCITTKQQERLAMLVYEVRSLIGGFIKSDKRRFNY